MARKGIRGAQNTFEGIDGLSRTYLQDELDSDILRDRLGDRYHFADLSYKPYPSCRMNHCAIDAALKIRRQPGFDWKKISEIRVHVNWQGNQAVGTPIEVRRAPSSVVQAQFSICYNIACALVNGEVHLSDFTADALTRPEIRALAAKVTPIVDPELERKMGRNVTPARVEAVIGDETLSAQVLEAKGNFTTPMSKSDLRRKLADCLDFGGFDPGCIDRFESTIDGLQESSDVAQDMLQLSATLA
jgi:2-methylcitrate dehydratase PrpD